MASSLRQTCSKQTEQNCSNLLQQNLVFGDFSAGDLPYQIEDRTNRVIDYVMMAHQSSNNNNQPICLQVRIQWSLALKLGILGLILLVMTNNHKMVLKIGDVIIM